MKLLLLLSALLAPLSLSLEEEVAPRKQNMVSRYVASFLEKLTKRNLSIGMELVELGEEVGRFTGVSVVVEGALKEKVDGIKQWGLSLDAELERVVVKGKYDLVNLDVPMLFPFFGKGEFSVILDGVAVGTDIEATYDFSKEEFDVELPRLEAAIRSAKVRFENLMNDPSVADFLNELISDLLPDLITMITRSDRLDALKPEIAKFVNGAILCVKNELLNNKVMECIVGLFKPTTDIQHNALLLLNEALASQLDPTSAS